MAQADTNIPRIRLLLVDDSALVRRGVRGLLEGKHRQAELIIAGEAGTVAEAIIVARTCKPDVVLLDIRLPDGQVRRIPVAEIESADRDGKPIALNRAAGAPVAPAPSASAAAAAPAAPGAPT